ncbi:M42 family metallopeptidase [Caproicibacter fermentans]|uniref:M42 family metallopeptidase n=1 Tax=Caproicibacter fermentans TaxID=2576756 RepID=A0A7G8T6P4_9FIRM|nr:M42 family metallopeptidase [Caproicibacter fermentans]QNK39285.1 M42 family metallopeptidase [Caproicibacter fermentans]
MGRFELLRELCGAHGISGREDAVRKIILREIEPVADSVELTPLGNIIAVKKGLKRPKTSLMLDAHMDEVGLIVTDITDGGLLKFASVGGIDRRVLPGKTVWIEEKIPGVVGAKPIHLLEEDEKGKSVPMKDLYLDIGAGSRAEAQQCVRPGDAVVFDSVFDLSHGMVKSKALDDRAGCALLIELMKDGLPYDTTFVFSVQEEVGLNGAKTAAFAVNPQAAIAVECTTAADVAGVDREKDVCCVGEGPVLSFMDRRTVYDRKYYNLAFEAAKSAKIKCQPKRAVAGGNNAGAIFSSRSGVRTAAVSLPCRYLHSPVGVISQDDYAEAKKLLAVLAERIAETDSV